MKIDVKFGNKNYPIIVNDENASLGDLKELIKEATGILPAVQKLLGKPNLQRKPNETQLSALGIKEGTKLMLIGSAVEDIVKSNTSAGNEETAKEKQKKLLRSLPFSFWKLSSFAGLMGDRYVQGKGSPLEHADANLSLITLDIVLSRINTLGAAKGVNLSSEKLLEALGKEGSSNVSHRFLKQATNEEKMAIQKAHSIVRSCAEVAAEALNATNTEKVIGLVTNTIKTIESVPKGSWIMLPAGWRGMRSNNVVYLLLKRTTATQFDVVVVNRGSEGQEYHPKWQTADGIRTCPFLRLQEVSESLLKSTSFWLVLYSLVIRANDPKNVSEYIRAEVFYDVLLPILSGSKDSGEVENFVSEAFQKDVNENLSETLNASLGNLSTFVTNHSSSLTCSDSSGIKSAVSAFCFLIEQFAPNLTPGFIKHLKFVLKYEFMISATEDLSRYAKRFISASGTAPSDTKLKAALKKVRDVGVDDTATVITIEQLFPVANENRIVIKTPKNVVLTNDFFKKKRVLVYVAGTHTFGAKAFATQVSETVAAIKKRASADSSISPCELLFLSADQDEDGYAKHLELLPEAMRASFPCGELWRLLDVISLPQLLIFDADGNMIHRDGVNAIKEDPEGQHYPEGVWRGANPLTETDAQMISIGLAQLAHHTKKRFDRQQLDRQVVSHVTEFIQSVQDLKDLIPCDDVQDLCGSVVKGEGNRLAELQDTLTALVAVGNSEGDLPNSDLLPLSSSSQYYGKLYKSSVPSQKDITHMKRATNFSELHKILTFSREVLDSLWARAGNSGTASRVAIQMQIIEYITWVFTAMVPVPLPPHTPLESVPAEERSMVSAFYITDKYENASEQADMQSEMLEQIHFFILSFTTAWQAVEIPTRGFDSERCLISMTMLMVFDAILRNSNGSKKATLISTLLNSEGGYYPSTTLGKSNLTFASVAATLELTRPSLLLIRSAVLRYIHYQQTNLRHELFDLRMPDKLEVRKNDNTMTFVRLALDNAGYALEDSGAMAMGRTEMDKLVEWLVNPNTPLAREHPSFIYLRNMVILTKFLGTMEMRDAQLLRRRKEIDPLASWYISFDEDGPGRQMSAGWRTKPMVPKWECAMVRGRDMDIADIIVTGFGNREVLYGEGLVMHSPINVDNMIEVERATEDDVLHATTLPKFGGALNQEEAEILLSCLTTPYIRIPLILDFFASQDRHTYLFELQVQELLRAVLFEPATFAPDGVISRTLSAPMRLNKQQREEINLANLRGDFSKRIDEECLGTTYGLLLNELKYAPSGVLRPLDRILSSVTELGPSSVYSSNATYVLYLIHLVCDVLSFCRFVISEKLGDHVEAVTEYHQNFLVFFQEKVLPLLAAWLLESEENADTPTQCVVHSYKSMVDRALWKGAEATGEDLRMHLERFLQSCTFVRARHGFGMGMQRSLLAAREGDDLLTPEEKVARFLQAQGLDTSRITRDMLEQGRQMMMSGGQRRAVFVHIRGRFFRDTVRMPNLFHSDPGSTTESKKLKLPPADLMENVLFCDLLEDHLFIISFLDSLEDNTRDEVLQNLVECVLRNRENEEEEDLNASKNDSQKVPTTTSPEKRRSLSEQSSTKGKKEKWLRTSAGVYKGPSNTGLLFFSQTCELFWRNDELKPVPDSMSHFTDFENILGKEMLQCGLVSRHENRHWVHIVGSVYDVMEWTKPPKLDDQGVHNPLVIMGNFPKENVECAIFNGVRYDRIIDINDDVPWAVKSERWAVELVKEVLPEIYQEMKFTPLAPSLATDEAPKVLDGSDLSEMRFLMCDGPQFTEEEDSTTWKELIAYRYPEPYFELYNLVPHARKIYRSLVYTTNQRYSFHSLPLIQKARSRESLKHTRFQGGDFAKRIQRESTLEIHRYNAEINGREVYLPARLLQGLIPSALLESFMIWQGEDNILRGYPIVDEEDKMGQKKKTAQAEMADHWFNYKIEIRLPSAATANDAQDGNITGAILIRRELHEPYSKVKENVKTKKSFLNRDKSTNALVNLDQTAEQSKKKGRRDSKDREYQLTADAALLNTSFPQYSLEFCAHLLNYFLAHLHVSEGKEEEKDSEDVQYDISEVVTWISDPKNESFILKQLEVFTNKKELEKKSNSASKKKKWLKSTDRVLVNMRSCEVLRPLLQLLTSVEDCSHILIWGTPQLSNGSDVTAATQKGEKQIINEDQPEKEATAAGEDQAVYISVEGEGGNHVRVSLEFIELPRLRIKFSVRHDSANPNRLRVYLTEQPDWRLAEVDDVTRDTEVLLLRRLRSPFQQSLVMCNTTQDFGLMVPNHPFSPMHVNGDPFNPLLLFERGSFRWRESVASPMYTYLIHNSHQFLIAPTLSASLYYAVMQCATHHYHGAMRTLESCYTDSPFSPEEAFMFHLFEQTVEDMFPDAHAVRLKLAHAVQYSNNEYKWVLGLELEGYLKKVRQVSSACRLKRGEVLDLLKRCTKAFPLVRSQLELYAALLKERPSTGKTEVVICSPITERCGFPWHRLLLFPWEKISSQKLRRVTYRAPPAEDLCDEKLIEFLWNDALIQDEEGGSNKKLGFLLLYDLKKGDRVLKLNNEDITSSLEPILTRWFHLRHARWGKEEGSQSENPVQPSWCSTVLQLMDKHLMGLAEWPSVSSIQDKNGLARGANTTNVENVNPFQDDDRGRRRSDVPDFFDKINALARRVFTGQHSASALAVSRRRSSREEYLQRLPTQYSVKVTMFDHLVGRVTPVDSSTKCVVLREGDLDESYFDSVAQRRTILEALAKQPLAELNIIGKQIIAADVKVNNNNNNNNNAVAVSSGALPFDLTKHPLAQLPMSQDMLRRLAEDADCFAKQKEKEEHYLFRTLQPEDVLQLLTDKDPTKVRSIYDDVSKELSECMELLKSSSKRDRATIQKLSASILTAVNSTANVPDEIKKSDRWQKHQLALSAGDCCPVTYEWICSTLVSAKKQEELEHINPFLELPRFSKITSELIFMMLLCNRVHFAEQSIQALRSLQSFVELCCLLRGVAILQTDKEKPSAEKTENEASKETLRIQSLIQEFSVEVTPDVLQQIMAQRPSVMAAKTTIVFDSEVVRILQERIKQLSASALDIVLSKRHYVEVKEGGNKAGNSSASLELQLDPRFLLFEFLFNIILRARQVEMVNWFVSNIEQGNSRVQQMIMGQGKTTVVGPLLALMLADGAHLVMQVMPTALLEQTRGILRRCFGVVLVKHIYSIQFDRNFSEADSDVEVLYQKLLSAEEDRSVVIAAPECIKSLFLKSIEQMHVLETVTTEELQKGLTHHDSTEVDERQTSHANQLVKRTIQRSNMADAITPILQLWKRGVLIMDEVDVLLHPLRSELNFPIGLKYPIDLSGPRWRLPMHLIDAMFYLQQGRSTEDVQQMMASQVEINFDLYAGNDSFQDPSVTTYTEREKREMARKELSYERLSKIKEVLQHGFEKRALQREPHLVLLDNIYYETELLPALVPWLQFWLYDQLAAEKLESGGVTEYNNDTETSGKGFPHSLDDLEQKTSTFLLSAVKDSANTHEQVQFLNQYVSSSGLKLLNLAHDWLHRLLPHVLSKIDRVSFGLLLPADLSGPQAERMPYSRQVMAVPFVAKDVPSRSSEFAHPDVVIGLSILAYRYEGLRLQDMKGLLMQLKQDFARQAGPKEHRPAAKLYRHWLSLSAQDNAHRRQRRGPNSRSMSKSASVVKLVDNEEDETGQKLSSGGPVLEQVGVPLSQLQVTDKAQLRTLHTALRLVPEVIHYYLCSCIFPRTMNFQNLKISACGHELGSSMLFDKRIGFSGTPSNLLPLDLGECYYEPGSDGRVLSVLTNPNVTRAVLLPDNWSARSVLDRIASAQPPFSALIDSGALITNMDNEDVARYLLFRLPPALFDGVVFLDHNDRQVILQRDNNGLVAVPVAQCGIPLSRRFTFFDQVHTTGTDVKQSATATAVITLGKDLVFRDYAQGAYRMRGIGKGQRLTLFLIPEVVTRLQETLGPHQTGDLLRDVPAWLLLNSMRIESLQFFKLSVQELANVWRKKALTNLLNDSVYANEHPNDFSGFARARRFQLNRPTITNNTPKDDEDDKQKNSNLKDLPTANLLQVSIEEFRETIEYVIDSTITAPQPFLEHLKELLENRSDELVEGDKKSQDIIASLFERMKLSVKASEASTTDNEGNSNGNNNIAAAAHQMVDLNAEIVHEQEAEEEQEQEAEQEEQRISAFSRDDEFQVPWKLCTLNTCGTDSKDTIRPSKNCCFYQVNSFEVNVTRQSLQTGTNNNNNNNNNDFNKGANDSDTLMQNVLHASTDGSLARLEVDEHFMLSDNYFRLEWNGVGERRLKNCFLFIEWLIPAAGETGQDRNTTTTSNNSKTSCYGLITLAEGESVRWLIHRSKEINDNVCVALRSVSNGRYMDRTSLFANTQPRRPSSAESSSLNEASLLYRFLNNDMFFSEQQLSVLESLLRHNSPSTRLHFFMNNLRVRRRHRNHWEDAPIATLFMTLRDRPHRRSLALLGRVQSALSEAAQLLVYAALPKLFLSSKRRQKDKTGAATAVTVLTRREVKAQGAMMEAQLGELASQMTTALSKDVETRETNHRQNKDKEEDDEVSLLPSLPAGEIATILQSSFPKIFQSYKIDDIAAMLIFATVRHVEHELISGVVSTKKNQQTNSNKDNKVNEENTKQANNDTAARYVDTSENPLIQFIQTKERIPLHVFYKVFPMLDLVTLHNYISSLDTNSAGSNNNNNRKKAAVSAEPWACEVCTLFNEGNSTVCSACLSPRPATAANDHDTNQENNSNNKSSEEDDDEEDGEVDGPWACPTCTFINDSREQPLCSVCLSPNPNPFVPKANGNNHANTTNNNDYGGAMAAMMMGTGWDCPEGHWVCSVEQGGCSKFNPNSVFYCTVCEKARPNLSSVRF